MRKYLIAFLSLTLVLAFYGFVLAAGGTSPEGGAPGCDDLTGFPWTSGDFLKGTYTVAYDKDTAATTFGYNGYQVHIKLSKDEKQTEMYSFPMPVEGYPEANALCNTSVAEMKTLLAGVACKFKAGEDFGYGDVIDKKTKQPIGIYVPVLYDLTIGNTYFCGLYDGFGSKEMISGTLTIRLVPYIIQQP
jgi:hypothetical protein